MDAVPPTLHLGDPLLQALRTMGVWRSNGVTASFLPLTMPSHQTLLCDCASI